jgi:hypothetical protein
MKTTIAFALLLSLSTIAADARAYFFQCGPTKVTVSAYRERSTVYYEVTIPSASPPAQGSLLPD